MLADFIQGLVHEWAGEGGASVIYETGQASTIQGIFYFTSGLKNGLTVRDVEQQRREARSKFDLQAIGVLFFAYATEDEVAVLNELPGRRASDPR